jgi:Domain of Unknown Function (DUF1206)
MSTQTQMRQARRGGEKVARSDAFEWLARAGFVARGLIYGIIGILAIKLAVGAGGETTNQQGALKTIAQQPFGKVLLILVAIGLGGYACWRILRALLGHGPEASDSGFERVSGLVSGIVYASLCVFAVKILLGSDSGSENVHGKTAGALGWPAGTWLVGIVGAILIGVGLYQGYRGITKEFLKDSKTEEMSPAVRKWIEAIGTFGHLARGIVFGMVGVFLIKAAVDYSPDSAVGLDGALAKLVHASYGPFLLGVVAAGFLAFALYSLSDARYRRI